MHLQVPNLSGKDIQFGLSALTKWYVFHKSNEALDQMVKQMIWY